MGGDPKLLVTGVRDPRFSPDGAWIAYWVGTENIPDNAIGSTYVIPASGGIPRRVGGDLPSSAYPVWAPDSKSLLVFGSDVLKYLGANDWWVVALDGGHSRRTGAFDSLAHQGFDLNSHVPRVYQWYDTRIIFTGKFGDTVNTWRSEFSNRTWKMTGPARRLTSGTTEEVSPSLTAGGLVFASLNATLSIGAISLNDIQNSPVTMLTDAGADAQPSLSADARLMVFTSRLVGNAKYRPMVRVRNLSSGREQVLASPGLHPIITRTVPRLPI
jgi:Tol biopolymer transport system component